MAELSGPGVPALESIPRGEHPGDTFVLCLRRAGLTQQTAATRLGISRRSVNALARRARRITADMAVRLAVLFPTSRADYWLTLQTRYDVYTAQQRPRRRNGGGKK